MKELKNIAKTILSNNQERKTQNDSELVSYFEEPVLGQLDYFTYSDFSNKQELIEIFNQYLSLENISIPVAQDLGGLAFTLYKENGDDDSGEISEFLYAMH